MEAKRKQNESKAEAKRKQNESKAEAKRKQNESKAEAKRKQSGSEKEGEKEKEREIEVEVEVEGNPFDLAIHPPAPADVDSHLIAQRLRPIDSGRFVSFYAARGWFRAGEKITDWRPLAEHWSNTEFAGKHRKTQASQTVPRQLDAEELEAIARIMREV